MSPFFAASDDLVALVRDASAVRPVDLVLSGLFAKPKPEVLNEVECLKDFETYLVVDRGVPIDVRAVSQHTGELLYAIDQANNPHTVALKTGGKLNDRHLVSGLVGTTGNSDSSAELYALFLRVMRKRFQRVKSFYVGPNAVALLDSGARLTATAKAPPLFDLVR